MAKFKIGDILEDPVLPTYYEVLDIQTIPSLGGTVKPHYIAMDLEDAFIVAFPTAYPDEFFYKIKKSWITL